MVTSRAGSLWRGCGVRAACSRPQSGLAGAAAGARHSGRRGLSFCLARRVVHRAGGFCPRLGASRRIFAGFPGGLFLPCLLEQVPNRHSRHGRFSARLSVLLPSIFGEPAPEFSSPLLRSSGIFFHVALIFLGYAALLLRFVASLLYLVQERRLKAKSPKIWRRPPLEVIDRISYRSLLIGC